MQIEYESQPVSATDAHVGPYKWFVVAMLWCVCFFNYADRQAIFSVFPLLKKEMGLSPVQLGIIGGAFAWVYAAIGPIAGLIGDRAKRKTLIIGGLIFWSIVTLLTALSRTYGQLVFFRAIEGFGEAFYFPAAMSIVSDYHGKATRSKAMAICQSSVYVGTIAGGTVAGALAQYFGWRSGFYVFGSSGVLLGIVLMAMLREPVREHAIKPSKWPLIEAAKWGGLMLLSGLAGQFLRSFFGNRDTMVLCATFFLLAVLVWKRLKVANFISNVFRWANEYRTALLLVAVFVCANFVATIFLSWMPSFLHDKFNMSLSMAGLNSTFWLQMFSVVGVIGGGILADRFAARKRGGRGGRMKTQLIGLTFGVPFIFFTGYTREASLLVLAMCGFGLFKGLYDANIWASLYDVVKPERRAAAVGFMNSVGWLGGGFAPVAIARASETFGMSACLSATSLIYILAAAIMFLALLSVRKQTSSWA